MKARALILTVGTTLALMAPAAQSASARSSLSCDYLATHALSDRGIAPGPFSAQNRRNMLAVATGQWVTSGNYALAGCSTARRPPRTRSRLPTAASARRRATASRCCGTRSERRPLVGSRVSRELSRRGRGRAG